MPPRRIILLRHGEKPDKSEKNGSFHLSDIGAKRAQLIAKTYLGPGAPGARSVFLDGELPSAFLAITPHTLETASPSAQQWGLPVICYSAVKPDSNDDQMDDRTKQAAADIMSSRWANQTIVVVWEHKRIAHAPVEEQPTQLRILLKFDVLANVPGDWPETGFGHFWVVTYDKDGAAARFEDVLQALGDPSLPP